MSYGIKYYLSILKSLVEKSLVTVSVKCVESSRTIIEGEKKNEIVHNTKESVTY